jgi:hypothetical protein
MISRNKAVTFIDCFMHYKSNIWSPRNQTSEREMEEENWRDITILYYILRELVSENIFSCVL